MQHRQTAEDRRIQKTLSLLRTALVSLLAEKPYDQIVVKEILDRANVGRSTFYTHFRDKDDLLLSGIHEMLGAVPQPARTGTWQERFLWFSIPIFAHHYRHAHSWGDKIGPRGRAILHEHLRRALAEIVSETISKGSRTRRESSRPVPIEIVSAYIASTFVLVLNWWLDKGMRLAPEEVNQIFLKLTSPTLAAVFE